MIVGKSGGFGQVALELLCGSPLHLQGLFQEGIPWELSHINGVELGSRTWRHPGSVLRGCLAPVGVLVIKPALESSQGVLRPTSH